MRTSKPIASISYNSIPFLKSKLEELHRNHTISDWMFIFHNAEEDERKDHIHLWIKPNSLIDTMDLQKFFYEIDLTKPDKYLGCIDFVSSKIDDWILYSQHYAPYLASKGESREFCYTKDDFYVCDEDTFWENYNHALRGSEWAKKYQILQTLAGEYFQNPAELITQGIVGLNQAANLRAFMVMKNNYGSVNRNGHKKHE